MKTDIIFLADVFEKLLNVSTKDYGINPVYCVSICSYTLHCCLKYTDIKLQILQDKHKILFIEKIIFGCISSVMGDRYIKSDENRKILYIDSTNLYGHSMSQPLPFDEIKFERNVCLNEILNSQDDNDIGYFLEVHSTYPYNLRQKSK